MEEEKKTTKTKEEEIKKLNIYEKLALITKEIGIVGKNLKVAVSKTSSYSAVSERDILDSVKPIEEKYRIYSYPYDRKIVQAEVLEKQSGYNGNITKTNTFFLRLETTYRFVNLDNTQEFVDIKTYGDGLDTGDKATGKAMTYADKYALMKAYKISTGDDSNKEASSEQGFQKVDEQQVEQEIAQPVETKPVSRATEKQITMIRAYYKEEEIQQALAMVKKAKIEDLTIAEASSLISRRAKGGE